MMKTLTALVFLLTFLSAAEAQTDTITFSKVGEFDFENILPYSAYSSLFNTQGDPYIYAACRELGVVTFDVSDPAHPVPVDTILPVSFNNLRPTNISQRGNYLFASIGGFDGLFPQKAGLAILDVSDPAHPVITDEWDSTAFNQGAAIAIADDQFAYLGAMDRGVVILNIEDKHAIQFVSSILPDPNFPEVPDLFSVPNARGLALYGADTLMVAYDAGGLRKIDISDRSHPVEIAQYANSEIEAIAQSAYNNIAIVDHYAYVTVDMCGMDVVDINGTDMHNVLWFNPWDCDSSNWVGRPGHTNGIKSIGDSLLFLSGGDSELLAFDISNPAAPVEVGNYAFPFDSVVAWNLDIKDNYVSLALINNEIVQIPYYSNVGGIMMLEMDIIPYVGTSDFSPSPFSIWPVPVNNLLHIYSGFEWQHYFITDLMGRRVLQGGAVTEINCAGLRPGVYVLTLTDSDTHISGNVTFIRQ